MTRWGTIGCTKYQRSEEVRPLAVAIACDRDSGSVYTDSTTPKNQRETFLFSAPKNKKKQIHNKTHSDPVERERNKETVLLHFQLRVSSNPTQKVLSKIRVLFCLITISFSHKLNLSLSLSLQLQIQEMTDGYWNRQQQQQQQHQPSLLPSGGLLKRPRSEYGSSFQIHYNVQFL